MQVQRSRAKYDENKSKSVDFERSKSIDFENPKSSRSIRRIRVNKPCPCQKPNRVSKNRVCRVNHVFVPCKPCRAKCRVNRAVSTECGRVSRVLPTVPTTTDLPAVPCKPCQLSHVFYIYIHVSYMHIYTYLYIYIYSVDLVGRANRAV